MNAVLRWIVRFFNIDYKYAFRVLCHFLGVGLVTVGVAMIYVPAGCIAAGIFLWLEAHGDEFTKPGRDEGH